MVITYDYEVTITDSVGHLYKTKGNRSATYTEETYWSNPSALWAELGNTEIFEFMEELAQGDSMIHVVTAVTVSVTNLQVADS
jgi:hypothetical protein